MSKSEQSSTLPPESGVKMEAGNNIPLSNTMLDSGEKLASLIGSTPLVRIQRLLEPHKYSCQIYAKCEFRSPSGSSWDRFVANKIIESTSLGKVHETTYFVTGGNNDLCESLAWAGAAGNFRVSVLPGHLADQAKLMQWKGFGANVILSYKQDPFGENTRSCLTSHIEQLNITSGIFHRSILPFPNEESVKVYAEGFANEILLQAQVQNESNVDKESTISSPAFDLIVCGGDNKSLLHGLVKRFKTGSGQDPIVVGVDIKENNFAEVLSESDDDGAGLYASIKWVKVTDAEAIDMTRRLLREEGLMVGHVSGAVMAAAIKSLKEYGLQSNSNAKVLIVLPDSLAQAPSREFLSTDWMVRKNYYDPTILESLFWYYDMALENINPPMVMTVPPDAPINIVWKAMDRSNTDRAVVVDKNAGSKKNTVVGVISIDALTDRMDTPQKDMLVGELCYKRFGIIDSKTTLSELEKQLAQNHWVVKLHRVIVYGSEKENPEVSEDVIGVINYADFMKFKKKIENHHFREYAIKMSDGIPSDVWLEKFTGGAILNEPSKPELVMHDTPTNNNIDK